MRNPTAFGDVTLSHSLQDVEWQLPVPFNVHRRFWPEAFDVTFDVAQAKLF
jgi:hypothetical protein